MENQSKKSLRPKRRLEQPQPKLVRTIASINPIDGLTMAWMRIGMYGVDRYRVSGLFLCMIPIFHKKAAISFDLRVSIFQWSAKRRSCVAAEEIR